MATVVTSLADFESKAKAAEGLVVAYFWASWHEPCQAVTSVIGSLAQEHKTVQFLQVEAEEVPEAASQFNVESVPTAVFISGNTIIARQEGADIPALVSLVETHASRSALSRVGGPDSAAARPATTEADEKKALNERLAKLVRAAPVMLFMKGSPDDIKCGFSRKAVAFLKEQGVQFGYFDILSDPAVRAGLKEFSNWKTYPQFYANGELLGGLDVVKEMAEEGEFLSALPKSSQKGPEEPLEDKLRRLINAQRVTLFMKGSPEEPRCGFSRKCVALMAETGAAYGTFDILTDLEVREGLKKFSNWPTYPQLYVDGELVGGLDVLREMHEDGELAELLQEDAGQPPQWPTEATSA